MNIVVAVAVGGAIGAVGRYLVMSGIGHWLGMGFPWATLTVNGVGSLAMGVMVELGALMWSPSPEMRAMLVVGVIGSFTTFSAFSLDVAVLAARGAWLAVAAYVVVSVLLSIGALAVGMTVVRWSFG